MTLLYLKWTANKDLLYSTWNSAQCYVAAWMGGEFGGEWIHVYVWLSHFAVHLILSQHGDKFIEYQSLTENLTNGGMCAEKYLGLWKC